ncbi:MAG: class I SAM-dependent methyltransferase [Phycisphaerales bacterium]
MSIEKAEYDKLWGTTGGRYSGEAQGYAPHFLKFMDRWFGKFPKGAKVLEVGCGDGFFSSQIAQRGCEVTGVDLSTEGLRRAKERTPAGTFLSHDLTQPMPFPDATFDGVWCSEVLEHLFSPLYVLEQMSRVLKPGGVALLTVPYHGLLKNLAIAAFAFEKHYDPEYVHLRFFTSGTLGRLVQKAGMKVVESSTCGSQLGVVRDSLFPTNILIAAQK